MVEAPAVRPPRLEALRRRHDGIQQRLAELAVLPARPAPGELARARRRVLDSQLAARRARMSYRAALYRAALAHDRAAAACQRSARATGDAAHEQLAASHRTAAAADRRRAAQIQA